MEQANTMRRVRRTNKVRRIDSRFYKLNRVLHIIFSTLAFISFFLLICVNDKPDDFWKPLFILTFIFMLTVFLAWYFDFPKKARHMMKRRIYTMLLAIDFICKEISARHQVKRMINHARAEGVIWQSILTNLKNEVNLLDYRYWK